MVNSELIASPVLDETGAAGAVEWHVAASPVGYDDAVAQMEAIVAAIAEGRQAERVWLVEHPPLYTAGTSSTEAELLTAERFPVFRTGRGGRWTYHGPGQRIAYVMLDLRRRGPDLRAFVTALENWLIATLAACGVQGERRGDRVGVWVRRPDKGLANEDKIAAVGIRVRRWVSYHGIALNVAPDLEHFSGIIPCGIAGHGVTSLAELGCGLTMNQVDAALRRTFEEIFGRTKLLTA